MPPNPALFVLLDREGFGLPGFSEWLSYVEGDEELTLDPPNGVYSVIWKGEGELWFDWYEGNVYTTNPDRIALEKMLSIAKALNAKVQGDNGEVYNTVEDLEE